MPNATIHLVDAFKYYKGFPSQVEAAEYLQTCLTADQLFQFQELYRKAPPPPPPNPDLICLYVKWSGQYDEYGLKIFGLYLMNGDKVIDKVAACSGQSYAQDVCDPLDDYSGSMRPCPEGVYDIGPVDDLGYDPGSSDGYGQWVVPLEPRSPIQRSLIRLHSDRNRYTSPGSAGCITPYDPNNMLRVVGWLRQKSDPKICFVDHGLGFLQKNNFGFKVPTLPGKA